MPAKDCRRDDREVSNPPMGGAAAMDCTGGTGIRYGATRFARPRTEMDLDRVFM